MYVLTIADMIILAITIMVIVAIFMVWPRRGESINITERNFILGVTAMRTAWNSKTGVHTIHITSERMLDAPPSPGDVIIFTEKGGDTVRHRVLTSENVASTREGKRPRIIVTTVLAK